LEEYRDEYQRRFLAAAKEGIGRDQWSNYQTFLARLDQAVAQQRTALEASRQQTSAGQKAWLGERNKAKAFDTLSQRHQAQVLKAEGKAEQKMTDEHAAKGNRDGDSTGENGE
ncbi:MAG: flagellar export protein FliJ, partial [Rhodocyclaceae bacterium]